MYAVMSHCHRAFMRYVHFKRISDRNPEQNILDPSDGSMVSGDER